MIHWLRFTITVHLYSFTDQYCKENNLNYTYPDANDWLTP